MFLIACAMLAAPSFTAPLQMRPVVARTNVRVESTIAGQSAGDVTNTTLLSASYAVNEHWAVGLRYGGLLHGNKWLLTNPSVNVSYLLPVREDFRLAFTGGFAAPAGVTDDATLVGRGNAMRAYMENATYGINDWSVVAGVDAAWASHGWTLQAEVNAIGGFAKHDAPDTADPWKVNTTAGLFAGYTFNFPLSLGVEAHYQRYLSDHPSVVANGLLRDSISLAAGARYGFELDDVILRPGVAYSELLHAPAAPVNHLCTVEFSVLLK